MHCRLRAATRLTSRPIERRRCRAPAQSASTVLAATNPDPAPVTTAAPFFAAISSRRLDQIRLFFELVDTDQGRLLGSVLRCPPRQVEHELASRARRPRQTRKIAKRWISRRGRLSSGPLVSGSSTFWYPEVQAPSQRHLLIKVPYAVLWREPPLKPQPSCR